MTLFNAHSYLASNAWQTRTVAIAFGAAAGNECGRERGQVVPQMSAPTSFGRLDSRTRLLGCSTKRVEDPAGWQEQRLL